MVELAIVVEGETEESFVNKVLAPTLGVADISAWPVLPGNGRRRRGGVRPWESIRRDVLRLLKQQRRRRCAILFDFYGLPSDWPGRTDSESQHLTDRAHFVESALVADVVSHMGADFDRVRFIPHIQLHEFEARLFSDTEVLAAGLGVKRTELDRIVEECGSPERIDDSPETAPSKRLKQIAPRYDKVIQGTQLSLAIGLLKMRDACPHFNAWLTVIERLQ